MKNKRIIIFIAAVALLITSVLVLSKDLMSPYVSFEEAKRKAGEYVQVMGNLEAGSQTKQSENSFSFSLKDETEQTLLVHSSGTKPVNFEHASDIAVLGRYNAALDVFEADKLLVKCPSKYSEEL